MIDQETARRIKEGTEIKEMIKSEGWILAKRMLMTEITSLSDIMRYSNTSPDTLFTEIAANQQAIKVLLEWLRKVEGLAETIDHYKQSLVETQTEEYIKRFG